MGNIFGEATAVNRLEDISSIFQRVEYK